ncbi:MAG: type II toxin-antitoxin system prevent-host-death family antitoxin [Burkholderiaceae bacterium]|nr:type II toxin-antitoxin system prevent-host-death family antitoxin [Burkholderiaceae bacterium]
MQTVTIAQAKNQLSSLVHAAEQGEEVVLTRHGKAVVRLVAAEALPIQKSDDQLEVEAVALLAAARAKIGPTVRFEDWRTYRDEGRRF